MSQAFNLRLSSVRSIYDRVVVREYVDRRLVAGFVRDRLGIAFDGIKRYEHLPYDCELDMIVAYKGVYNKNYDCFVSSHGLPKHLWGRINPNKSLSGAVMHRPSRHALFRDKYVDLDMVNCQPVLMVEILKQNQMAVSALDAYVADYKAIRAQIAEHHKVSKDVAKQLPIRILFGGTYASWRNDHNVSTGADMPLFVDLQNQMTRIMEWIWKENKDTIYKDCIKYKELKKEWATEAEAKRGVMGLWCQTVERMVQETAIQWLVDNKRIPLDTIIPCQDGCMVLKEHYYEGITEDMSRSIAEKYGINVGWVEKPFDEAIDINPAEIADESFESVAMLFEETHCKIINNASFIKQTPECNIVMSRQSCKTAYEHITYKKADKNGKETEVGFINDWMVNNPNIRKYDDIGCYPNPSACPKNHFNMWIPFDMERVDTYTHHQAGLDMVLEHIFILCNRDRVVADYIVAWVSQMIQYPEVKSICPTFISNEGTGKGTFIELLKKMLGGSKVLDCTNPDMVFGQYNGALGNAFLVYLNELQKKDIVDVEGRIKGLITDPTVVINAKYQPAYSIPSYHRFIISTNNEEPVNTKKDDRRKLIIRCSDELIRNKAYFDTLYGYIADTNVVKTCYEYFKNYRDASGNDMSIFGKIPMPITEYQSDLQEMSVSPIQMWLRSLSERHEGEDVLTLRSQEVFDMFNAWKQNTRISYDVNMLKFCVRLKRLNISGIVNRHTRTGNIVVLDIPEIARGFGVERPERIPVPSVPEGYDEEES